MVPTLGIQTAPNRPPIGPSSQNYNTPRVWGIIMNMNEKQTSAIEQPSKVRPTKKQKELLAFIEQFIAEHGYSPSYREIMNGLDYTSVATVSLHVNNLIARGHLVKRDHSARSLEVVKQTGETAPLLTNEVSEGQEKWLVQQIDKLFADAGAEAVPSQQQIDDLAVVLLALQILGLSAAAQSFAPRLAELRSLMPK